MDKYLKNDSNNNIILYNNLNNIKDGVDILIDKYVRLYEFGLSMSGFQFIGLTFENSGNKTIIWNVSYFLLTLCFVFSLFGSTISYIVVKYLNSIKNEDTEFILAGIYSYRYILTFSEFIHYLNSGLFLISINFLVHTNLGIIYSIIFNVLSFILFVIGIIMTCFMNFKIQNYKPFNKKILRKKSSINSNLSV